MYQTHFCQILLQLFCPPLLKIRPISTNSITYKQVPKMALMIKKHKQMHTRGKFPWKFLWKIFGLVAATFVQNRSFSGHQFFPANNNFLGLFWVFRPIIRPSGNSEIQTWSLTVCIIVSYSQCIPRVLCGSCAIFSCCCIYHSFWSILIWISEEIIDYLLKTASVLVFKRLQINAFEIASIQHTYTPTVQSFTIFNSMLTIAII
jgi:hypothetical protein